MRPLYVLALAPPVNPIILDTISGPQNVTSDLEAWCATFKFRRKFSDLTNNSIGIAAVSYL